METQRDPLFRLDRSTIVRQEDIERFLTEGAQEMEQVAADHAAATRANFQQQVESAGDPEVLPATAHVDREQLANAMRSYLEDHVVVLDKPGDDVNETELERALIRQALVKLRGPALEEIIRQQGKSPIGKTAGDLARQVAEAYGWDPAAVARLVLDHTDEPQATAGGWSTRLFQMQGPVDVDLAEEFLGVALRRFVSVGAVRWFVFDELERLGSQLRLKGRLRTFTPKPNETPDGETAVLGSESATYEAVVVADDGSKIVRVEQARTTTAARAAASAFAKLSLSKRQSWVSGAERDAASVPGRLHPQTELLLEIVRSRLPANLFSSKNAILARFRISATSDHGDVGADVASISAWRAEGRHLLNTPSASKLMLTEGRPLVDLTFTASMTDEAGGDVAARCATRLVLESDHVLIETGLAGALEEQTRAAHRAAVSAVEAALTEETSSDVAAQLVADIRQNESGDSHVSRSILDQSQSEGAVHLTGEKPS